MLPNELSAPASSDRVAEVAFHFPSGEQGGRWSQGTFPWLTTWKVLTAKPTFVWVRVLSVYLTRMFETWVGGRAGRAGGVLSHLRPSCAVDGAGRQLRDTTYGKCADICDADETENHLQVWFAEVKGCCRSSRRAVHGLAHRQDRTHPRDNGKFGPSGFSLVGLVPVFRQLAVFNVRAPGLIHDADLRASWRCF